MNDFINRHTSQKSKSISVTTLVFFLLAFFIHVQHVGQSQSHKEQNTIGESQDCHLCQQGVDSPPKLPLLLTISQESFALVIFNVIAVVYAKNMHVNPLLRAPPTFQ